MSKFRGKAKNKIINRAGGQAYKQSPKLELVSLLLTSFLNDGYYESKTERLQRLRNLVSNISDKKFIAKSAIYARTQFGMRSITHALLGELVRYVKGEQWVKDAIDKAIYRPDDMLEILGYWLNFYGKPIPNNLKKGLSKAIHKFDEYQLAKYRGENKDLKLVDLFNIVHPKPLNEAEDNLYNALISGNLKSKDTWEVELTQAGQEAKTEEEKAELKKKAWNKLIGERKIGYFALLRNLRNILEQADNIVEEACEMLTDEKLIKKSLVLPFRYITALKALEEVSNPKLRDVTVAISRAVDISLSNVPKFEGRTLVALDESGSMQGRPFEIGSLFAAVFYKMKNADLLTFSEEARFRNFIATDSTISIAQRLQEHPVYAGTNFHCIFKTIENIPYDRIIILSDMQAWVDSVGYFPTETANKDFINYCNNIGKRPYLYSFDLAGYGDMQFPEKNVFCIAGFSEKIFDAMKFLEADRNALLSKIEEIDI